MFAGHPAAIEEVSGLEVRLDLAREWTRSLAHTTLFGPWSVKVVNELDRCSKDAQDMLLTYRNGRPTILIANLSKDQFAKSVSPSIASRMVERGGAVNFDWKSYRLPK